MESALMPKPPVPTVPKAWTRLKQGHTPQQQHAHQHRRDKKIQQVQHPGGVPGAGGQLTHHGTGHFRLEDVHGPVGAAGDHGDKHQHAHAAHPMGKAAPEQQPVAHGFHVRQNRRTRSGEAADRLENASA